MHLPRLVVSRTAPTETRKMIVPMTFACTGKSTRSLAQMDTVAAVGRTAVGRTAVGRALPPARPETPRPR